MSRATVLVIDDNPVNARLLAFLLAADGFDVHTASDAPSALAWLESRRPDLILMDIQLPGMDGLTLTRLLRASPATRDVGIVAVTAYAMRGDAEKALAAGCDDHITKPVDTRTFAARMAACLDRSRVNS